MTCDDIVTAKDILTGRVRKEDIIGKKGWFLECIPEDMSLNVIERIAIRGCLKHVELSDDCPFVQDDEDEDTWTYFLPEKEEPVCNPPDYLTDESIFFIDFQAFCSLQTLWEMYRDLCPEIKGYTIDDKGYFIAFDNTAREFFVEDFDTREEAVAWLRGEEADKPEYIPFDLSLEEDRDALRDRWIRSKQTGNEARISAFKHTDTHDWQAHIPQTGLRNGKQLLDNYEFLDGSAVGKPANGQK